MNIAEKLTIKTVKLTKKEAKVFSKLEPYQSDRRWTHELEHGFKPMNGQEMSLLLNINPSYITETLKKLHEVGWITRHRTKNKNPFTIELTEAGAVALDDLKEHKEFYTE